MRIHLLAGCAAAAILISGAASAQSSCETQQKNQVVGTVAGAAIGATIGTQLGGRGAKSEAGVIGGIAGAIIGNQVAKPKADCAHAYGYYDKQGAWHVNDVSRDNAQGFYDRDGRWVEGVPAGYYDEHGAWRNGSGRYDDRGRWIPPSERGYYDDHDHWVEVSVHSAAPPPPPPRPVAPPLPRYDDWNRTGSIHEREDRIRDRIQHARDHGDLDRRDAARFRRQLDDIMAREARLPHRRNGELYPDDEHRIQVDLDDLSADIRSRLR